MKSTQTLPSRGRRSRNKVSVGEPAEGSLVNLQKSARRIVPVETHVHVLRVANPHTCASMTPSAALHGLDWPGARVLFTHS